MNFLMEWLRFCEFLLAKPDGGTEMTDDARDAFGREYQRLRSCVKVMKAAL